MAKKITTGAGSSTGENDGALPLDFGIAQAIDDIGYDADGRSTRASVKGRGSKADLSAVMPTSLWKPSKTFPTQPRLSVSKVEQYADAAMLSGINGAGTWKVLLGGKHGTGKTSYMFGLAERWGKVVKDKTGFDLDVILIPAQTATPEDQYLIGVKTNEAGERVITNQLYKQWAARDTAKVIVIDEINRAEDQVLNQMLELVQDQRLGDLEIPNVLAIFGLMNEGRVYAVKKMDWALASRFTATVDVDIYDTPWELAVANSYPDLDLSDLFKAYRGLVSLDSRISDGNIKLHDVIVPRTLDHIIWCAKWGFPGMFAVPMPEGDYQKVIDKDGKDLLPEAIGILMSALKAGNPSQMPDKFYRVLDRAWDDSRNVHFCSDPGMSKTSSLRVWAEQKHGDAQFILLHGATTNPDKMFLPVFNNGEVDVALMDILRTPEPKIICLDDWNRAEGVVKAKFMEILTEGRIGGIPIVNLRMVVAFSNPRVIAGVRQNVSKPDFAQADRYWANVFLTEQDMLAGEYLLSTYGEDAAVFLDWRAEDLTEEQRQLCNFRVLEALLKHDQMGLDLETSLPKMNGKRVPIPLHDLRRRIDARPVARIRAIAENVELYRRKIKAGDLSAAYEVVGAFKRAEASQLAQYVDAVMVLLPELAGELERTLVTLLRQGGQRTLFWFHVLEGEKEDAIREITRK